MISFFFFQLGFMFIFCSPDETDMFGVIGVSFMLQACVQLQQGGYFGEA